MGIFGDYAQKYYELGLNVMPVIGKAQPTEKEFNKWKDIRMTQEEIDFLVKKEPDANIALLPGLGSQKVCIDFDYIGPNAKELEKIILNLIPPTDACKIGAKGFTRIYKNTIGHKGLTYKCPIPRIVIDKEGKEVKKQDVVFEIQSGGRYTVIPPSIHPDTGTAYIWTQKEIDFDNLPELPGYIIGAIIQACDEFFKSGKTTGRNDTVWSYAYKCVGDFDTFEAWRDRVLAYDKEKHGSDAWFDDPKERKNKSKEAFIEYQFNSWLKTIKKAKKQYEGIDFEFGKKHEEIELFYGDEDKINSKFPSYKDGFIFIKTDESKKDKDGNSKEILVPLYSEFSDYIRRVEGVKIFNKNYIYWHNSKHYEQINDMVFKKIISKRIFAGASVNYINNYFKRCEIDCQIKGRVQDRPVGLINLKNGVIDLSTNTLLPHSKKYFFTNTIDVEYNKDSKCTEWIAFLNDVMDGNQDLIKSIQQIFGYILLGGEPFLHKAFVFIGSGRNGKGIVINVLKKMLGSGAYSIVPLSMLDKPFSLVMLDDSIANISEETPSTINSEAFKNIVAGGEVQAAKKGKDEYSFKAKCRMVFACNDFPYFDDKNTSINDRLFIIPFNKTYVEGVNRDPFKLQKILPEMSGILNWAIEGAIELLKNPIIKQSDVSLQYKEEYREETDPVYAWFKDNIEIDYSVTERISVDSLYSSYIEWSEKSGHRNLSKPGFGKRLRRLLKEKSGNKIDAERYKINEKTFRGYGKIKNLAENPLKKYDLLSRKNGDGKTAVT